ncbi:hypothetical protein [Kallotenue papyrolyticum]|uniref:hypothetical protein n=1 Tax=Kallotenue papyrolyticum TaxID=1325125 RepID=UPI001268F374|nr:hypothetical protein [Kallotenue papyrolyticum]
MIEKAKAIRQQLNLPTRQHNTVSTLRGGSGDGEITPDYWVWADWYGQAKMHNDSLSDGSVKPNMPGWACRYHYNEQDGSKWVIDVENAVWLALPTGVINRSVYMRDYYGQWVPASYNHYYASDTGWTKPAGYNYYIQVPERDYCFGNYNPPPGDLKIRGQHWVD